MKHAHPHTHPGEDDEPDVTHGHFHEHDGRSPDLAQSAEGRKAHKGEPHEHEHTTRKVTLEVTFDVGTLEEIGLGGFKVGWLDAQQGEREFTLSAGAGVGSPLLEASVRGPDGQPSVYASTDIRTLVSDLWTRMTTIQGEMAAAASSDRSEVPAAAGQENER